jgi:hypothetical protein
LNRFLIIALVFFFFISACGPATLSNDEQIYQAGANACNKIPISGSTPYSKGAGIHPIVLVDTKDTTSGRFAFFFTDYPAEWWPQTINNIQLVACITIESEFSRTCQYKSKYSNAMPGEMSSYAAYTLSVYRRIATIQLIEASTLNEVFTTKIENSDADICPNDWKAPENETSGNYYGQFIRIPDLIKPLSGIVNP